MKYKLTQNDGAVGLRVETDIWDEMRREFESKMERAGRAALDEVLASQGYVRERTCTLAVDYDCTDDDRSWTCCSECYEPMSEDSAYCSNCGARLVK